MEDKDLLDTVTKLLHMENKDLLDAVTKLLIDHVKQAGDKPHICRYGHVHGKPDNTYLVQVVSKKTEDAPILGVVAFNAHTNHIGMSVSLDLCYGETLKGLIVRLELIHDDVIVWSSPWTTFGTHPTETREQFDWNEVFKAARGRN